MPDINLTGTFLVCQVTIPRLIAGGGTSSTSRRSRACGANSAHYIASKCAVGLTKALATEFGPQGVIVNAVAPATIPETGIGRSSLEQKVAKAGAPMSPRRSPTRRATIPCAGWARPTTWLAASGTCSATTLPG